MTTLRVIGGDGVDVHNENTENLFHMKERVSQKKRFIFSRMNARSLAGSFL